MGASYPLQEVSPVGINHVPLPAVGRAHQLGHQMKVADFLKEIGDGPEVAVGKGLFQVSLAQAFRVLRIVTVRAAEDEVFPLPDALLFEHRPALFVLGKGNPVAPVALCALCLQTYFHHNI